MKEIVFFNRYTNAVEEEKIVGEPWIRLSHSVGIGKLATALLFKRKFFSMIFGKFASSPTSRKKIKPFVEKYGLKSDSFEKKISEFTSFNDFFIRKLKPSARPISPKPNTIVAPVDGRHLAYVNMRKLSPFFVKGERLSVEDLIIDKTTAKKFTNGSALISRLSPIDYHRFHFPIACIPHKTFLIRGEYSSVHPRAMDGKIDAFLRNKKTSTLLHTENCGDVLMVEIGAMCVGSIQQTFVPKKSTLKGDEKGYFEFGGSTVILIFENGRIQFSDDILENTASGMETYVLMGDEVATIL
ncbi:MAG: archaetidylserine decarboxylase [Puniceicoccales bacterium]|jgi:phosphatidylserine decarboxylase|nr:archaetidylserine decarboxylase [Puniceicoccales bacterium]